MELPEHLRSAGTGKLTSLAGLEAAVIGCTACPRLVEWRRHVAMTKRRAYVQQDYWGRPVPGFGAADARLVVLGLAPGAHGANRTGRMFTGDRSGDWLYRAMYRARFANQPTSVERGDGLALEGAYVTAAVRCVPPANKPVAAERDNCARWLDAELELLTEATVMVCLGGFSFAAGLAALRRRGLDVPRPRPRFGHGVEVSITDGPTVLASYHPSQQNTFTGRLTEEMLDAVFARARRLVDGA